jgi:hypothetical protein
MPTKRQRATLHGAEYTPDVDKFVGMLREYNSTAMLCCESAAARNFQTLQDSSSTGGR